MFWAPLKNQVRRGYSIGHRSKKTARTGVLFWASLRARAGPGARESPGRFFFSIFFVDTLRTQDKALKYSDNPRTSARLSLIRCIYSNLRVAGYGPRSFKCPGCVLLGPGASDVLSVLCHPACNLCMKPIRSACNYHSFRKV